MHDQLLYIFMALRRRVAGIDAVETLAKRMERASGDRKLNFPSLKRATGTQESSSGALRHDRLLESFGEYWHAFDTSNT